MRLLRVIAITWLTLFSAASAGAADPAATLFVTKIYDAYKGKDSKGVPISTEAEVRRWFEPSLAALIIKDEKTAAKHGDVGTLEVDPFIGAQDWEISAFDVAVIDAPPGKTAMVGAPSDKATATVAFKNIDTQVKVVLNLVKVKNDWRIADIVWTRKEGSSSLRDLFTKH
jgi:hypothetical protein